MESKIWPGKYHAQGPDKYGDVYVTSDLGGESMRMVIAPMAIPHPDDLIENGEPVPVERSRGMAVSTARLFAAAPELLEALQNMVEQAEFKKSVTGSYGHFADSVIKARDAIFRALCESACATGEQNTVHPSQDDS